MADDRQSRHHALTAKSQNRPPAEVRVVQRSVNHWRMPPLGGDSEGLLASRFCLRPWSTNEISDQLRLHDQGSCLPLALAEQGELVGVESLQTAPMSDADDRAIGHSLTYQLIDCVLHTLVERGCGLVEKCQ